MTGQEKPVAPEFREYILGTLLDDEEPAVHPWTGEIEDKQVRTYLAHADKVLERHPEKLDDLDVDKKEELNIFSDTRKEYATESGSRSVFHGRQGHMTFFSGLVGYENDVSGMQALMQLQQLIEDTPVFIAYVFGQMGSGKTDFSNLIREVFRSTYDNVHEFANFESDGLEEQVERYSTIVNDLEERREKMQDGEDLDPYLLVLDEAAQLFTGSGADQQRAKALAKILKLARKSKANVVLIGQDGKDIGPSLRALCTMFVHKESQKKASIYRDVVSRQGQGEMMTLSKVPATSIEFETYDEGSFVFDPDRADSEVSVEELQKEIEELEKQHERRMMAVLAVQDNDMTQSDIGDIYGVTGKTVRRAKSDFEDELAEVGIA